MKKLFLAVCCIGLLSGCGSAFDELACRQAVVEDMGTADIFAAPDKKYTFIVRDKSGAVWLVKTMDSNSPKVTSKTMIFGAR